jgi:hypothetical protein
MRKDVEVVTRPVRQITIKTGRTWSEFRDDYERAVPIFDRLEAIGVVRSGGGWEAIRRLSAVTAVNGFVNFFEHDPSPVMHLNGSTGDAVTYLTGNIVTDTAGRRLGGRGTSATAGSSRRGRCPAGCRPGPVRRRRCGPGCRPGP